MRPHSLTPGEGGTGGSREPPQVPVPVFEAFTPASLGIPSFAEIMPRKVAVGRAQGPWESVPAAH